MFKIAILGCENSHAKSFLAPIRDGLYPELEVVGVYSNEPEAAAAIHEEFGVHVMERYDELVGQLDGLIVTARHGDNHYRYAKPYLASGIPMFIDKPFTCLEEDGEALMREAKANGVKLCGGSICALLPETQALAAAVKDGTVGALRGGAVSCPIYMDSPYGGFFFYAQHLVDIMTAVFGEDVRAIRAERTEGGVHLIARYDGYCVSGTYGEAQPFYSISVYGEKATDTKCLNITAECFRREVDDLLELLHGAEMAKSYESFLLPVYLLNATVRSLESGAWESVHTFSK